MITMEDWVTIRNLKSRNPELGSRQIAKLLRRSRNTVKKALQFEKGPLQERSSRTNPDIEPYYDYIYERLVVKRLRGSRVLDEINSKGYKGSQSAFYRYIQRIKTIQKRTFQPYETQPGEQAQFDWTPFSLTMGRKLVRVFVFLYILSWSRYKIYRASLCDTQGSVLEALESSFRQTDGVPMRIQTDNASCFVTNASRHNFQWNKRYQQFCGYYGIEPTRSLPRHPWSKGKVENPFDYLQDHFIAGNEFAGFEDFQRRLEQFQQGVNEKIHTTQNKLIATHTLSTEKSKVIMNEQHYQNHRVERGNWQRLCAMFSERFAKYNDFPEKLKTQKRINHLYHLTRILQIAEYFTIEAMNNAFEQASLYNAYNHSFIEGILHNNAQIKEPNPSAIEGIEKFQLPPVDIKRPLNQYQLIPNHYEND